MIRVLAPLPVLLPLLGAGLALAVGRHPRLQRTVSVVVLATVLAVAVALLLLADDRGATSLDVGGWPAPLGITLVVDRLSALFLVVSTTVTLAVLVYAVGQGASDRDDARTPLSIFHPTYLVLTAGVANAFLSGDLFNLYVGFEVLLAASYVLLTLGGSQERVRAGVTYVVVSLLSSLVFLAGIAFTYAATGTLNMAQLSLRLAELDDGTRAALNAVLLVAFGIKAAVFPLSSWLPDSYPTALAPVTAVFAGLLTKVGVYAIIRVQTLLFPDGAFEDVLMLAAGLTLVVGILGAVAQTDVKRMLSFTLVSHIGYMVFGVALGSAAGLAGAIFYVAHHILIQTVLFLAVGLVERHAGTTSLTRLGGLAAASPLLAVLFFVPAMNLAGIPPLSGFIGKAGLLRAGVEDGGPAAWALVGAGTLTSLLTLYAVAKVWSKAFWRPREEAPQVAAAAAADTGATSYAVVAATGRPGSPETAPALDAVGGDEVAAPAPRSRTMVASTVVLLAVSLSLTVLAGPLYGLADRAADDLLERSPYLRAATTAGAP
ncbi:Na+/H+ antiporter subunit D [Vallicoccus soli]|uniref:Na+/H+ antiporter subunit D n=1 Tax=Vallicoccus soli TaxID=2339232 RepID=A0A3A3Z0P9_9ACTN|nr:Na+/H+ antiporter subunit D [Vallicoccus soli]RJK95976.1 Na+/H+ antiporter subunit D [Vallicoccus soli]